MDSLSPLGQPMRNQYEDMLDLIGGSTEVNDMSRTDNGIFIDLL